MYRLDTSRQKSLYGGGVSAAFVSALLKGLNIFTDLGRYLGSSIRRMATKNICR